MRHAKSLALFACAAHAFVARPGPASLRARPVSLSAPLTLRRQAEVRDEDVRKETTDVGTDTARQLLGMKDAASDEDIPLWKIRLQLTKPVTWVPLVWGVACGAAASGNFHWWNPLTIGQVRAQRLASPARARARHPHGRVVALPARARARAGGSYSPERRGRGCRQGHRLHDPLGPATHRLHADDERLVRPRHRRDQRTVPPDPIGQDQARRGARPREYARRARRRSSLIADALSVPQVIVQIWALLLGGLGLSLSLDNWAGHEFPAVFAVAVFGSIVSYIYSAPPLKLKAEGWLGTYALGSSYIALPWWCGQCMFNVDSFNAGTAVLTMLYSIAGLGIAIVNDFKSIEGDRELGLRSLPVQFGVDTAKWLTVATIDVTQLSVAAYL